MGANEYELLKKINKLTVRVERLEQKLAMKKIIDLDFTITYYLHELGVPSDFKGHTYIHAAIMKVIKDPSAIHDLKYTLYPYIAKLYNTSDSNVERNIRHAIKITFSQAKNNQLMEELFSSSIDSKKGRPTNLKFISLLTNYIRLNEKY